MCTLEYPTGTTGTCGGIQDIECTVVSCTMCTLEYPTGTTGTGGGIQDTEWLEGKPYREHR